MTSLAGRCVCLLLACAAAAHAQEWAARKLDNSPRRKEWVQVAYGERTVRAFLVHPEKTEKTSAIVVIHGDDGLTEWVRSAADALAEAGHIAIAPDLLQGAAQGLEREAVSRLKPDVVLADLDAVAGYVKRLPGSNGLLAVAGFGWGGTQAFRFANVRADLSATAVVHGAAPDNVDGIRAPVYGFYAGADAELTATVPETEKRMRAAGKYFVPATYKEVGPGFLRSGEAPEASAAEKAARDEAWKRLVGLLEKL